MTDPDQGISPALATVLTTYRDFLVADDDEREQLIEDSEPTTLAALADAVAPLFDEINSVLDRLSATAHPLPDDQEQLESDLNSLAQVGIEARMQLDA